MAKNRFFLAGILGIALVFGFAGCNDDSGGGGDNGGGGGGKLTITDIPANLNGQYIYVKGATSNTLGVLESYTETDFNVTVKKIEGTTVELPMYISKSGQLPSNYTGSDSLSSTWKLWFYTVSADKVTNGKVQTTGRLPQKTLESGTFNQGSMTVKWTDLANYNL